MLSNLFKAAKTRAGLTNKQIADASNVAIGTINRMFGGNAEDPRASNLIPVCKVLNVTIDELYRAFKDIPEEVKEEAKEKREKECEKICEGIIEKHNREKKLLFYSLLAVIGVAILVILIDIFTPSIGWVVY